MLIRQFILTICLSFPFLANAQITDRIGAQLGAGVELIHPNNELIRSGLNIGADITYRGEISDRLRFIGAVGLHNNYFLKTIIYEIDCATADCMTFAEMQDSLPGRNLSFLGFRLTPTIEYILNEKVSFGFGIWAQYNISASYETYGNSYRTTLPSYYLPYLDNEYRDVAAIMYGIEGYASFPLNRGKKSDIDFQFGARWAANDWTQLLDGNGQPLEGERLHSSSVFARFSFF